MNKILSILSSSAKKYADKVASRLRIRAIACFSGMFYTCRRALVIAAVIDRILDMGRTTVNITGDASCVMVVSNLLRKTTEIFQFSLSDGTIDSYTEINTDRK